MGHVHAHSPREMNPCREGIFGDFLSCRGSSTSSGVWTPLKPALQPSVHYASKFTYQQDLLHTHRIPGLPLSGLLPGRPPLLVSRMGRSSFVTIAMRPLCVAPALNCSQGRSLVPSSLARSILLGEHHSIVGSQHRPRLGFFVDEQ